jgi:hypothetical protein
LGAGTGPPLVAATAIAAPPPMATTTPAMLANNVRVGAVRRNLFTISVFLV